jgi:hypothetical protein
VLRLVLENLADPKQRRKALDSPVNLNAAGAGGANVSLISGFAVSSGTRICIEVTPGPLGTPMRVSNIVLRGYLVTE